MSEPNFLDAKGSLESSSPYTDFIYVFDEPSSSGGFS